MNFFKDMLESSYDIDMSVQRDNYIILCYILAHTFDKIF